ncbi:MAG: DUF5655 domain-containing protein [Planctomycetota bacterium]
MSDIKLFRLTGNQADPIAGATIGLEKTLQSLMEANLETLLGVRFLVSEHHTGAIHGGRIDTLGLDEDGAPVIIEYKRTANDNIINQGLFYLDWLLDHRGEFELLVQKQLGPEATAAIDWPSTRLLCIASDFNRYDDHAVRQINRNIELIRYRRFEPDLFLLELATRITGPVAESSASAVGSAPASTTKGHYKTMADIIAELPQDGPLLVLLESVRDWMAALGDDVEAKQLKYYLRFRRLLNFASIEIRPQKGHLLMFIKVDPATVDLEPGFTRDVSNIGHLGVGNLEITIPDQEAFEKAQPLIQRSYEGQ